VSIDMLSRHRNLIPVLSLEGGKDRTDTRRGAGTYDSVIEKMDELKKNGLFFGTSVTVTKENMNEVLSDDFITGLDETGCGIVLFIEYVPVGGCMAEIAPDTESRKVFDARLKRIRKEHRGMVFMSFPGDERNTGGCLGAGRGFFHINPYGDAEACPASPHSDVNIMNGTVEDALRSRLFSGIRADRLLSAEHDGGCALIQNSDRVAAIIDECTERTTSG
jgi:MoaA/NifB/PqqE/SkfB family radical SAM enzyme